MELTPTVQMLYAATNELAKIRKAIFKLSTKKAETERAYRIALSQESLKLRFDRVPVSIAGDIARGNVADLKYERDLALETHRAALAAMESLKAEINALQSIAKYQSDI